MAQLRRGLLGSRFSGLNLGGLVGNQVPSEDLEDIFGRSYHGRHIQSHVDGPGHQPLLLNIVACKSNGEEWADDRDSLQEFLRYLPAASLHKSLFWLWRHRVWTNSRPFKKVC